MLRVPLCVMLCVTLRSMLCAPLRVALRIKNDGL